MLFTCSATSEVEWGKSRLTATPGLSDQTTGVISSFLVALMKDIPFFIDCSPLDVLFGENMIAWRRNRSSLNGAKNILVDGYGTGIPLRNIMSDRFSVVQSNR